MEITKEKTALQLRSLVTKSGELELSLASIPIPVPTSDEVLVRVEATPINPSDLGLLFGAADMGTARQGGTPERPVVTASIPEGLMKAMAGRLDESMPVGNEGAGTVVGAGDSEAAQALMGKTVAILGGAMYAQYRTMKARACLVLPAGTPVAEGASCFVNPLTSLAMVETMRAEGHKALVHTAAASNLGQMLNKICLADGIALVNIVRSDEQVKLLKGIGATHVCNLNAPDFLEELTAALVAMEQPSRSTPLAAASSPGRSSPAWKRRSTRAPRSTAATARRCTSRSTSTAASIPARRRLIAASACRGAWAGSC